MDVNPQKRYWSEKPFWCKPWSIILFGSTILFAMWLIFHNLIILLLISLIIFTWWYLFLILAPSLYEED